MGKTITTFHKELLLLMRDRAGLLMLFAMPAVLVFVVCLVQEKVLDPTTRVLVVDNDRGVIGKTISEGLGSSTYINVDTRSETGDKDGTNAKKAVNQGDYQFAIVIPEGCTEFVRKRVESFVSMVVTSPATAKTADQMSSDVGGPGRIIVYFDPSVQGGFRTAIISSLSKVLLCMEYQIKIDQLISLGKTGVARFDGPINEDAFEFSPWLDIQETYATEFGFITMPTSVQQNVPAWALFGIFFISVPLAGSLIKERENKTLDRLMSMPVSGVTLLAGKIGAYILVCGVQFSMIFLIGKFLLPLAGTSAFILGDQPLAIALIVVATTLAATGYGIMLGTVARTYEQTAVLGPISIVIAAALGGVMVPVYLMPEPMQLLSNVSPFSWALDAFYDIFLRGGDIHAVVPEAASLLAFSAITITIAWIAMKFRKL
ncbi:MAG: ABC transporter permease [Desulfobacterium sp.]|nr:ABC transporter permease [Desulfobacterium sp.]